jgi:hypothetical protein
VDFPQAQRSINGGKIKHEKSAPDDTSKMVAHLALGFSGADEELPRETDPQRAPILRHAFFLRRRR